MTAQSKTIPDKNENYTNAQMVRVPRNIVNLSNKYENSWL